MILKQSDIPTKNRNLSIKCIPYSKINLKWIMVAKGKYRTIKLLEKSHEKNLRDLGQVKGISNLDLKPKYPQKEKN